MADAKEATAATNEAALLASLNSKHDIGKTIRDCNCTLVELPVEPWRQVLAKAKPSTDIGQKFIGELISGAAKASSSSVVVVTAQARMACQLAGV